MCQNELRAVIYTIWHRPSPAELAIKQASPDDQRGSIELRSCCRPRSGEILTCCGGTVILQSQPTKPWFEGLWLRNKLSVDWHNTRMAASWVKTMNAPTQGCYSLSSPSMFNLAFLWYLAQTLSRRQVHRKGPACWM